MNTVKISSRRRLLGYFLYLWGTFTFVVVFACGSALFIKRAFALGAIRSSDGLMLCGIFLVLVGMFALMFIAFALWLELLISAEREKKDVLPVTDTPA